MRYLVVITVLVLSEILLSESFSLSKVDNVLEETTSLLRDLEKVFNDDETECFDERDQCNTWMTNEGDNWTKVCTEREFLRKNCKKTCELCDGTVVTTSPPPTQQTTSTSTPHTACEDKKTNCLELKEKYPNGCKNGNDFFKSKCPKTCNLCDATGVTTSSPPTQQTTSTSTPHTACEDKKTNCLELKEKYPNGCKNGNDFFKSKCPKTCNLCDSEVSTTLAPTTATNSATSQSTVVTTSTDSTTKTTGQPTASSDPVECNDENKGHCECADTTKGFQTYTFEIDEVKRCFTVFRPMSRASEKLPVVLSSQCYAKDRLSGINMLKGDSDENAAAERYGYSRIGLSTPDGHWTFGNDGIVNDKIPMPCSESDSKDISYVKTVFQFIHDHSEQFNEDKIYAEGFSQNSMFSAYIGFCFSDKVLGIWQGGSGMALTGLLPNLPGCQGQCSASAFSEIGQCRKCIAESPCTDCQYWPIYPCYQDKRPVIDCLAEYTNDGIAVDRDNQEENSTPKYMYKRLVDEGHDGRLLRFSPSDDGTVPGTHQNPKNKVYWHVGCLGITSPCSNECEAAFIKCVDDGDVSTAAKRVESFEYCIEESYFSDKLNGCTAECAPTLDMLKSSEEPEITLSQGVFGAIDESNSNEERPSSSRCEV